MPSDNQKFYDDVVLYTLKTRRKTDPHHPLIQCKVVNHGWPEAPSNRVLNKVIIYFVMFLPSERTIDRLFLIGYTKPQGDLHMHVNKHARLVYTYILCH